MSARRSKWVGAWFDLARTTARASERLGKAALKRAGKEAAKQVPPLQKAARQIMSGVATPAKAPAAPNVWPISDLVALTAILSARPRNSRRMALISTASPTDVEVACALI